MKPRSHVAPALVLSFAIVAGCGEKSSTGASARSGSAAKTSLTTTTAVPSSFSSAPIASAAPTDAPATAWSFDKDETGKPPTGFDIFVSPGDPKTWTVEGRQAPPSSPNVLGIYRANAHDARPTALVLAPPRLDARVSVSCAMASPRSDTPERPPNPTAACGLVARFQDAKNYYLAAANAHDHEVALYVVKAGNRTKIGGAKESGDMAVGWHQLTLSVKGDGLSVSWEGKPVYETHDKTFSTAGGVGMWTFVNSLTEFDDFSVTTR